ncbi:MAG: c-type cytochrome [Deltaproteobacteria bacterium]|nr:c-type cytochrome [Deltaproteobacteria bacterium]
MRAGVLLVVVVGCGAPDRTLSKEQLGELIFHDPDLSEPRGQACADCHDRKLAFSDPEDDRTSMGVVRGRMGVRNALLSGHATLDEQEARGLATFEDPARGNCASCHPNRTHDGTPPLFTDFSYANIGVPRFADNPFYELPSVLNPAGADFIDRGLATTTGDPAHVGMFRVPTLRNVAVTGPFTHNGYFRQLDELIAHKSAFATKFPPEVPETVDREHFGTSRLTKQEIADLIAFLQTLTDT